LKETQIEQPNSGMFRTTGALVDRFMADLERCVRKTELGMATAGNYSPQNAPLERAYFHDILDLLFDRAAGEIGRVLRSVSPITFRRQLQDNIVHTIKCRAHRIMIDSELSGTDLMNEFLGLLSEFLSNIEKESHCPQIAA
jgi:hypothetical protein